MARRDVVCVRPARVPRWQVPGTGRPGQLPAHRPRAHQPAQTQRPADAVRLSGRQRSRGETGREHYCGAKAFHAEQPVYDGPREGLGGALDRRSEGKRPRPNPTRVSVAVRTRAGEGRERPGVGVFGQTRNSGDVPLGAIRSTHAGFQRDALCGLNVTQPYRGGATSVPPRKLDQPPQLVPTHEPTHARFVPGGEHASVRDPTVHALGGVRGRFEWTGRTRGSPFDSPADAPTDVRRLRDGRPGGSPRATIAPGRGRPRAAFYAAREAGHFSLPEWRAV